MKILGIETSADDSGIALIETSGAFDKDFSFKILGNALASQTEVHAQYGGIFPAMAKREHAKNLPLLLNAISKGESFERPDAIAVTVGPGLEPCLWQGITLAQELAKKWDVPVVATNHMEGHLLMSMVRHENSQFSIFNFQFQG